jgi:hypothetical protein
VDEEVIGIYPSLGSVVGGTAVTVYGSHFANTSSLACKFGTLPQFAPSVFHTSTKLECISPAHVVSWLPVEITNNGFEFTQNNTHFNYIRTWWFVFVFSKNRRC